MKYSTLGKRSLLLFAAAITLNVCAFADDEIGAIVEGQINLGKRTFALPPGKWTIISEAESAATLGVSSVGRIKAQHLSQVDSENRLVATLNLRTTTSSAAVNSWNDSNCAPSSDVIFLDTFNSGFSHPACFVVNHLVNYGKTGAPANDYDKKIYSWLRDSKASLPQTGVILFYIRYFAGDFVTVRYMINPDFAGIAPDNRTAWNQSLWHKDNISASPERVKYVDALKLWSKSMIASSDQSLRNNKPEKAGLPPFPKLDK